MKAGPSPLPHRMLKSNGLVDVEPGVVLHMNVLPLGQVQGAWEAGWHGGSVMGQVRNLWHMGKAQKPFARYGVVNVFRVVRNECV